MCEARVLQFLEEHNRPYNSQMVVDHLAHEGFKKSQVVKALESLTEAKKVHYKEFGKTAKIYVALQNNKTQLSAEEMAELVEQEAKLKQQLSEQQSLVAQSKAELQAMQISLSLEEATKRIAELQPQLKTAKQKLSSLTSSSVLVSKVDRDAIEKEFQSVMQAWRRRRGIFKEVWDPLSENISRSQAKFFEEVGIEDDEPGSLRKIQDEFGSKRMRTC